jgi:hypothetical protein
MSETVRRLTACSVGLLRFNESERLDSFKNNCNTLAHANAHGAKRIAATSGVQAVYGGGG